MNERIQKLWQKLSETEIDAALITNPKNMFYFSGFTGGELCLLLTRNSCNLITDSRYTIQARQQAKGFAVHLGGWEAAQAILKSEGVKTLGFEDGFVTVAQKEQLSGRLFAKLAPLGGCVDELRFIKDKDEIAKIKAAQSLGDAAFSDVLTYVSCGMTELEAAARMEFFMKKNGASGTSFATIVASGPRSAMPHGEASQKAILKGELLLFDFGCVLDGYCSDMTRTVCMGQAGEKEKEIYAVVKNAQEAALSAVCPGVLARDVDKAARDVIAAAGFGDMFGHSTGHGVGLDIHEGVRVAPRSQDVLAPGMVFSVEPGVYVEGFGGVRIEDLVAVTASGFENLTHSDKNFIEL